MYLYIQPYDFDLFLGLSSPIPVIARTMMQPSMGRAVQIQWTFHFVSQTQLSFMAFVSSCGSWQYWNSFLWGKRGQKYHLVHSMSPSS